MLVDGGGPSSEVGIASGRDTLLATWAGTTVNDVFLILLRAAGFECQADDVALLVADCTPAQLRGVLDAPGAFPTVSELSAFVENLRRAKYDDLVNEALLRRLWAARAEQARSENAKCGGD